MYGLYRMTVAELEEMAALAFDLGAVHTLLRIAERKAELLERERKVAA